MSGPAVRIMSPDHYRWAKQHGYTDADIAADGWTLAPMAADAPSRDEPPTPEKHEGFGQGLVNFGNEALQGATFGLADEAVGLLSPSTRDAMRERSKAYEKEHPYLSFGAQMLGGAATGGLAAKGLGAVATKALPSVLARIATSLPGESAILSGAAAAGAADDGNRLQSATLGAAGGAIAGPLISSLAGRAISSRAGQAVTRKASDLTARVMGREIGTALPSSEPAAVRAVARALKRGGKSVDDVTARLQSPAARRAELALMDEVQPLTEAVTTLPGKGAEGLAKDLRVRGRGRTVREATAIDEALGTAGRSPMPEKEALVAARAAASDPLYAEARAFPATNDPRVALLAESDDMAQALKVGAQRVRARNAVAKAEGGATIDIPEEGYAVAQLDEAKRYLDKLIARAKKNEDGGAVDVLTKQKNALTAIIDDATKRESGSPVYNEARAAYAGPSGQIDAMKIGQKALRMRDDDLAAAIAKMGPEERAQFRVGLADAAKRNPRWIQDVASENATAGGRERTLAAAFDDPDQFAQFKAALDAEALGAETRNRAVRGSPTAPRAAAQADLNARILNDAASIATQGPKSWLASKADAVASRTQTAFLEKNRDKIAEALRMRPGSPQFESLIQQLARQATASRGASRALNSAIGGQSSPRR